MSLISCAKLDNVEKKHLDYIPVVDCSDILKSYQIQDVLQGGGQALIYKVRMGGKPFALKIMPTGDAPKSVFNEVMIGCRLNSLVDNNTSKAYLIPVGWILCNTLPEEKYINIPKIFLKGKYYYLVMPWAPYILSTIGNNTASDYDIVCMIFELLYGLVAARFYFKGFAHNDIKAPNIFIDRTENTRTYHMKERNFHIRSKLGAMLADFGQSYATSVNVILYDNKKLNGSYPLPNEFGRSDAPRLIDAFITSFPQSSLIPQLIDLKTSLSIKDQGYQDYETIINTLTNHKLFERLRTEELAEGPNITNMLSWEEVTA